MFLKIIKYFLIIVLSASNSIAEDTSFTGEFVQGGVVIGKNSSARKVIFDNQKLELSEDGYFIFGFGRNHKKSSSLKIIYDNKTKLYNFNIKKSHYKIEKIDGLAPKMVEPGPEFYKKIKADLQPCKRKDIMKNLNVNLAKDSSMNLNVFKKIK